MLTIRQANNLLNLLPIPVDIQNKILTLIIGFGTPSSRAIQPHISCLKSNLMNNSVSDNDSNTNTLWRLNVFLNNDIIFNHVLSNNLCSLFELRIAYLSKNNSKVEQQRHINSFKKLIINYKRIHLFRMFYNLDKNIYYYLDSNTPKFYGTPTANIIQNAMYCGILTEYDPIAYYMNIN